MVAGVEVVEVGAAEGVEFLAGVFVGVGGRAVGVGVREAVGGRHLVEPTVEGDAAKLAVGYWEGCQICCSK